MFGAYRTGGTNGFSFIEFSKHLLLRRRYRALKPKYNFNNITYKNIQIS